MFQVFLKFFIVPLFKNYLCIFFIGQQVAVLLREVEAARFGRKTRRESGNTSGDVLDADGAISDRLVSFKDVQELQTRNSELLMVIREVTAKQEASEAKLVEERTADLKKVNAIFFKEFEM